MIKELDEKEGLFENKNLEDLNNIIKNNKQKKEDLLLLDYFRLKKINCLAD